MPKLSIATSKGKMSPYHHAYIQNWKIDVSSVRQDIGFGYLDVPTKEELSKTNELRRNLNIRSLEIRNRSVNVQEKKGMNFYLAGQPWVYGKIIAEN